MEIVLDPNRKKREPKPGDLERRLKQMQRQPQMSSEDFLQQIASAYKEGLEACGPEEARRRMRAKYRELNGLEAE